MSTQFELLHVLLVISCAPLRTTPRIPFIPVYLTRVKVRIRLGVALSAANHLTSDLQALSGTISPRPTLGAVLSRLLVPHFEATRKAPVEVAASASDFLVTAWFSRCNHYTRPHFLA